MPGIWWYEKRGCWCADVPCRDGKRSRKRIYLGSDETEARRKFHEYMAAYHADAPADERTPVDGVSVFALSAKFFRWVESDLSANTAANYKQQLKDFVSEHGARQAADMTPSDIEAWKQQIRDRGRGRSARTVNFFVQSVKRMFNWGVEQELLSTNPIKNVKRVPKDPPRDRSLDDDTVATFLKYARTKQPLGDVCEVLYHTGMRVAELLNLKWSDLDFEQGLARVYEHKTAARGEQRPRTIPLTDRVRQLIEQQPRACEFVFTGKRNQPLTYGALKSARDRLEAKHDNMPHVNFHQFRHTLATNLAREGVPERVAKEILGHSSVITTRYYTNTPVEEMLEAVGRIGPLSDGAAEPVDPE